MIVIRIKQIKELLIENKLFFPDCEAIDVKKMTLEVIFFTIVTVVTIVRVFYRQVTIERVG